MGKSRKPVKRFRKNSENKCKMKKMISKNIEVLKSFSNYSIFVNKLKTSIKK